MSAKPLPCSEIVIFPLINNNLEIVINYCTNKINPTIKVISLRVQFMTTTLFEIMTSQRF